MLRKSSVLVGEVSQHHLSVQYSHLTPTCRCVFSLFLIYFLPLFLDLSGSSAQDPLDAFMTAVRSDAAMDAVERRKLHVHVADLRKDAQRLRRLVELTRPVEMPSLRQK